jgi:hypothetical protein
MTDNNTWCYLSKKINKHGDPQFKKWNSTSLNGKKHVYFYQTK